MSAREQILSAVRSARPALRPLPHIGLNAITHYPDPLAVFSKTLEGIGGKLVVDNAMEELQKRVQEAREKGLRVWGMDTGFGEEKEISNASTAAELESIEISCIRASIGVAENGAVWIPESVLPNRLLPFICQHLCIILSKAAIVSTMHQAYQVVDSFGEGFGLFLAGPSKTADIEQSLVIGAHGARSLTVYLIN